MEIKQSILQFKAAHLEDLKETAKSAHYHAFINILKIIENPRSWLIPNLPRIAYVRLETGLSGDGFYEENNEARTVMLKALSGLQRIIYHHKI